jgi:hypothetical protein
MTPKQELLAHIENDHSRLAKWPGLRRATLKKLQSMHSTEHHRNSPNHFHTPDNKGSLVGPNSTNRRPSGWLTGADAVRITRRSF